MNNIILRNSDIIIFDNKNNFAAAQVSFFFQPAGSETELFFLVGLTKSSEKQLAVSDYVIVKYDEEFYPGELIALSEYAKVCTMIKSGPNYWKWPTREDIVDYKLKKW